MGIMHHRERLHLHDAEIGKNVGEVAALDAEHRGSCRYGGVVQARRGARSHPPLGAKGIEQAEGWPCIWPDLHLLLLDVIQCQPQRRQLLGGGPTLVAGPGRRPQFPNRAGL